MRRVLLLAATEYRRTIGRPAFWIVSLTIPLIVAMLPLVQQVFGRSKTVGYVLVDKSGHYAARINHRVDLDYERQVLLDLLVYAQQWRVRNASAASEGGPPIESLSDSAVQNFISAGGAPAVLRLLRPKLLPNAPAFRAPARPFVALPFPDGLATDSADRFGASIGPLLQQASNTRGKEAPGIAIYIPDNVDSGGQVRVWTVGPSGSPLVQAVRLELTQGVRLKALREAGVDPLTAAQIEGSSVLASIVPLTPASRNEAVIHSALPLALAYLLLISMLITGSMMLQGLVEERSNKLLEAVLACASARELIASKLLGISAIGLSILGIWIGTGVGLVYAEPSSPLGFLIPALASLSQTPGLAMIMAFYFLAGYLTVGMMFLAMGTISDSPREAQTYLTPLVLLIGAPAVGLAASIYRDPNSLVAQIFSWIPLYTPVTMLIRLQNGVPPSDIPGTALVLVAFGTLEWILLGRLFDANLIRTGAGFRVSGNTRRVAPRVVTLGAMVAALMVAVVIRHNRTSAPALEVTQTAALRITDPPSCGEPTAFRMEGPGWNGWSIDPRNWRFQPDPGLTAADVPRLKVKWAFSYVGGEYGQPTVVGGRLFLTSTSGAVYSIDAKTGCLFWRFAQSARSRTTVSVGPAPGVAPSGYAAYFGDFSSDVYAVDAAAGTLLWKTRVDQHPRSVLTGPPMLFKDRVYVPVSSSEEGVASLAGYSCCTFRGSVVALDAQTGGIVWKAFAIEQPPIPLRKNRAGTQMYGPAGAAVWSTPTIDAKRSRLYFATGNSYTDAVEGGSDAVLAVELASGKIIWRRQLSQRDNELSGCGPRRQSVNCPLTLGRDHDFGASPVLMPLPSAKEILLAGQKSGTAFGIDPDTGNVLWKTQVGAGGTLGGVEWGMASDGARLYVSNADVLTTDGGRPGLFALDPATGKDIWYAPTPRVECRWSSGTPCFNAQSAAPSVIPGVVFGGTTDGHERAYAASDGSVLWDFDTAGQTYRTINGVSSQGGGPIDVSSGTIAGGMLFLISGYLGVLGGNARNVLLAFSVDGR